MSGAAKGRADVDRADPLEQKLRELLRPAGHPAIVCHELRHVRSDVRRAGAGRRDDRLVAVEDLHESPGQRPRLVQMAGVEVHLPAAGLLARELELETGAVEDACGRTPDLRRERVSETGDEESVRQAGIGFIR